MSEGLASKAGIPLTITIDAQAGLSLAYNESGKVRV